MEKKTKCVRDCVCVCMLKRESERRQKWKSWVDSRSIVGDSTRQLQLEEFHFSPHDKCGLKMIRSEVMPSSKALNCSGVGRVYSYGYVCACVSDR